MTSRSERGSVAAEFVVALPAVIVVLVACLGGVRVGMEAMAAQDAAATAARSLARGEPQSVAAAFAVEVTPGVAISAHRRDGLVCVTAVVHRPIVGLPIRPTGTACALEGAP